MLMRQPGAHFDQVDSIMQEWYDTYTDTSEATGYMAYVRWRHFWERRAGTEGQPTRDFDGAFQKMASLLANPLCADNSSGDSFWTHVGPVEDIGTKPNRGLVWAIAVDPSNNDVVYIGSNSGGLWKTDNIQVANPDWENITNDSNLPGLGINEIAIDPNNSNIIYISTGIEGHYGNNYGVGILKSINGGITWQSISPVPPSSSTICQKVIVDHSNSNNIYATIGKCFYKSTDGGATWTSKCEDDLMISQSEWRTIYDLEQHPTNANILYLSTDCSQDAIENQNHNGSLLSVSYDGGDTWVSSLPQAGGTFATSISLATNLDEPDAIYAAFKNLDVNAAFLYKSTDSGVNWTSVWSGTATLTSRMNNLIVTSTNPTRAYMGGFTMSRITIPNNGSASRHWINTGKFHVDVRSLALIEGSLPGSSTNSDKVLCGHDGGLSYTPTGSIWQNKNGNFGSQLFHGIAVSKRNSNLIFGGCQDNHNKIYNQGLWEYTGPQSGDGGEGLFDNNNAKINYAQKWCCSITNWSLRRNIYDNNGDWASQGSINVLEKSNPNMPLQQTYTGELFAGWKNLYKLENPAVNFNNSSLIQLSDFENQFANAQFHPLHDFAVSDIDNDIIYAVSGGATYDCEGCTEPTTAFFYKSTSGGGTGANDWEDYTPNLPQVVWQWYGVYCMDIDPDNHDKIWLGTGRHGDFGATGTAPYNGGHRVIASTDGGLTWTDYSDNLPPFPVNDIIYEPGTRDALYAATDVGVFYTNDDIYPTDGWVCYGNHLPTNIINDIEINTCENTIYASVYGQGVWRSPLATSTPSVHRVTTDQTWESSRSFSSDLLIQSGATLTVESGVKLTFDSDAKIIVEEGAALICDGCTLTNACEDMWQGIEVHGYVTQHQYQSGGQYLQGRAIFTNGATIENAICGVKNYNPTLNGGRGGIIKADETNFINCEISAEFKPYQNFSPSNSSILRPELSYFTACHFEINDDYLLDLNVFDHNTCIKLSKTDRLRIEGSTFLNSSTVNSSEKRSRAIYSLDANYMVREHCNDPFPTQSGCQTTETPNTFTGWHKAIEATGATPGRPVLVRNSTFTQNMIGVELKNVDYSEVYWNDFQMGNHPFMEMIDFENDDQNHLGVYVNETQYFSIEENSFEKAQDASYQGHGVLVYNSDGNDNRVYKNTFHALETGENGWQVNRNPSQMGKIPPGGIGLQFLCNTNTDNEVDFEVSRTNNGNPDEYLDAGIRHEQGTYNPDEAAGNTFSTANPDPSIYTHYTVNSDFNYTYVPNYSQSPTVSEMTPGAVQLYFTQSVNGCPLRYGGDPIGDIKGKLSQATGDLQGLEYTYGEIIDDGNTTNTLNEIALTWPEDAWNLRDQLMARAPYNSEEVLIAAAKKEIMPHAMLLEVLIENPDALRSGKVIKAVETELVDPMPDYMVELLHLAKDERTLRTSMESTMGSLHAEASVLQKRALSNLYFNTEETDVPDSSTYYLQQLHTIGANTALAFAKANDGNYTAAISLLDSTFNNYKMEVFQANECLQLIDLLSFVQAVETSGRSVAELDSTEIVSLRAIAENNEAGLAAVKAQNILCFHYGICYTQSGTPKNNANQRRIQVYTEEELLDKLNNSKVFPSPADGYATIEFQLAKAKDNTVIRIYDGLSRKVHAEVLGAVYEGQVLVDTRDLPNGIYILEIIQEDIPVETNKFIVTH